MQILQSQSSDIPSMLFQAPLRDLGIGGIHEERLSIPDIFGKLLEGLFRIKKREYEIPTLKIDYVSGYSDEYDIIETREGLLKVSLPKDPLIELEELGKGLQKRSLSEAKEEIRKIMEDEFSEIGKDKKCRSEANHTGGVLYEA